MSETERTLDADAKQLKQLGYDQELERSWGQFTNFAISFSIISILAGCFTTYGQAWNNGGPIAICWGWPIISAFILIIGFCMSEILSAFPTAGGIYYWSLRLGGPAWGWFTGLVQPGRPDRRGRLGGLRLRTVRVVHDRAVRLGLRRVRPDQHLHHLHHLPDRRTPILNLFPGHILKYWNNTSAYWHIAGPIVIALILIFGRGQPPEHLVRVHRADQQLGLPAEGLEVLVLRPAARIPADPVHDHRV